MGGRGESSKGMKFGAIHVTSKAKAHKHITEFLSTYLLFVLVCVSEQQRTKNSGKGIAKSFVGQGSQEVHVIWRKPNVCRRGGGCLTFSS